LSLLSAIILICTNTVSIQTAVVGVNTSPDYVNPSGVLAVVDIESKSIVYEIDIMGQPDAVDVSKDEQYIVVAIENERDEDLGDGVLPQMPAGFVVIIDTPTGSTPEEWAVRKIDMTGLDILYPEDPEPEYVSINADNIAVVTMQENNGIALIDLASGEVTTSFIAGEVDIDQIDTVGDSIIMQTDSATLLREPDGITWIGTEYYATANEG
jgi:DNA-binding beta-propeller fold protein YncE